MCDSASRVLHAKAQLDLSNADIAAAMTRRLGRRVGADTVQKYLTGQAGIPLESLDAFLSALGMKLVSERSAVVSRDKLHALQLLARESLDRDLINEVGHGTNTNDQA